MTEERLAELEKKWSQQFDGHEVIELIREVRRLEGQCCVGCKEHSTEYLENDFHLTRDCDPSGEFHAGGYADCLLCHPDLDKSSENKDWVRQQIISGEGVARGTTTVDPDLDKSLPRT